jgi:hypothetical protein
MVECDGQSGVDGKLIVCVCVCVCVCVTCVAGSGGGSKSTKAASHLGETVHWSGVVVHLATPVCVECAQHAITADRVVRLDLFVATLFVFNNNTPTNMTTKQNKPPRGVHV